MLKYFASEKYRRDKHMIHFLLMGVFVVIILVAAYIYFS